MKSRLLGAVCACTAVVSFNANAALTLIDNGTYTTDENTGLDWLDLTETVDMSYNDVSAELDVDGRFDGWTYATSSQVKSFFDSAGGTAPYNGWSSTNNGVVIPLLKLWGKTRSAQGSWFITAEIAQGSVSAHKLGSILDDSSFNQSKDEDFMQTDQAGQINDANANTQFGSALVRIGAVPVPAAIWLFGSGLLGLIGISRRRKA